VHRGHLTTKTICQTAGVDALSVIANIQINTTKLAVM